MTTESVKVTVLGAGSWGTEEVYRILYEGKPVREVVLHLMRRSLKKEMR